MPLRDFPIPGILFFTSGNPFSGSYKGLSYRIEPIKGDAEKSITAHVYVFTWTGEKCSALSEIPHWVERKSIPTLFVVL